MQAEEIAKYERARKQPIAVEDTVYIPSLKKRGFVLTIVANQYYTVLVDEQSHVFERSDILRVESDA
jgi:hypothetical protein